MKRLHPGFIGLLAVLLLLPGLAFFALRLTLPGDASSPLVDPLWIHPGELAVRPAAPDAQGLQSGDLVTAIQGQSVDEIVRDRLSFQGQGTPEPPNRVQYTVLREGQVQQVESPLTAFSLSQVIRGNWSLIFSLIYLELVIAFVFILRPHVPAVRLIFVVASLSFSSSLIYFLGLKVDDLLYQPLVILYLLGVVVFYGLLLAGLVHMSLIFPRPHPLLQHLPGLLPAIYLGVWLPIFIVSAARWQDLSSPAAYLVMIVQVTGYMSVVYLPLLLVFTYSNYRSSNAREKRQLRWILWSLMISLIPYLIFSVAPSLLGIKFQIAAPLLGILWCTLPTSFAIAVLHERLFDIDVIIRRTLIYSALMFTLGAVFFFSVLLLQQLFTLITGQNQSPLATVISTLVITALFTPLRKRIQNDIDRRFFRRRYNAEKVLREFALQLRSEMEMEKIAEDLLRVVDETMEPQKISLWIC